MEEEWMNELEQAKALNEVLIQMVHNQKEAMKNLIRVFVVTIVCYTLILISGIAGFFWYESQFEVTSETVTTVTETYEIDQETSGENSTINNVQGEQNIYEGKEVE